MTKFAKEFKKYCSVNKYGDVVSKYKKNKGKSVKCWIGLKEIDE